MIDPASQVPPTAVSLDLSVVTYNSARWMAAFLQSLLKQRYPVASIRLLVRDNGSDPAQYAACKALLEDAAHHFADMILTRGENVGFGAGHNHNLRIAQAPLFLVCNVDIEFHPDSIARAVAQAMQDPERVACWEFRQQPYEHPKLYHPASLETGWCSSACALFRRSALERVGGYETRIFLYGEDVELSYRLRDHGYILKYCPQAVCIHHTYTHAGEIKPRQFFGSTLANLYLRLRYGSPWDILVGWALFLALWLHSPPVPDKYAGLAANLWAAIRNTPYFLRSRKRSDTRFAFLRWDYGVRRSGAFHVTPPLPTEPPLVSIIVRTYAGRQGWLRECLKSLAHQTYPRIEVIVVEDGSREAADLVEEYQPCFERIVYLPQPKRGRCHAGNVGLENATGELLGFLDDDDLLFADHLEVLVAELSAHPECELAYAVGMEVATRVHSITPLMYEETRHAIVYRQPYSRFALWNHNYIPIQTALFRRTLYLRHGGFDETLEYLEDWNLWTRFSLDASFHFVDKTTSLYRVPADGHDERQRQDKLDGYYATARSKQRNMQARLSLAELETYFHEHARHTYLVAISFSQVRKLLVSSWLLRPLLWPARIVTWAIRRRRRT
ncbi:MAG: glycosyltransferase [Methylophilaceae bacterium]|nr:glycosyltransferase [Methylophilaceae bacterium]